MNASPERARFRSSGGEIAFTDVGEGPAVLLLHGFPLWSAEWRQFIPLLAPRSRVIAPDALGAGASDMPADQPLHIRAQAGYIGELLEHLGIETFAVVGHGTGGGIAQLLALDGHGVEAMILIDATSFSHWPSEGIRELQERSKQVEATEPLVRAAMRRAFDAGARHRSLPTDDLVEGYVRPYLADPPAFFRAADSVDGLGLSGRESEFAEITCPVLILWGEDDPFFPVLAAEHLNEAIDSSTLGLLPGCGHFLPDEAPETIAPMIAEYLRAMYLKTPHGHAEEKSGVVMLQLERRPPWVDLAEDEADDWFVDDDEGSGP